MTKTLFLKVTQDKFASHLRNNQNKEITHDSLQLKVYFIDVWAIFEGLLQQHLYPAMIL